MMLMLELKFPRIVEFETGINLCLNQIISKDKSGIKSHLKDIGQKHRNQSFSLIEMILLYLGSYFKEFNMF